jgi:hypothetical protein
MAAALKIRLALVVQFGRRVRPDRRDVAAVGGDHGIGRYPLRHTMKLAYDLTAGSSLHELYNRRIVHHLRKMTADNCFVLEEYREHYACQMRNLVNRNAL